MMKLFKKGEIVIYRGGSAYDGANLMIIEDTGERYIECMEVGVDEPGIYDIDRDNLVNTEQSDKETKFEKFYDASV